MFRFRPRGALSSERRLGGVSLVFRFRPRPLSSERVFGGFSLPSDSSNKPAVPLLQEL